MKKKISFGLGAFIFALIMIVWTIQAGFIFLAWMLLSSAFGFMSPSLLGCYGIALALDLVAGAMRK